VPPEAVFAAWTDPESIKQWFAPRPYSITRCEIDLRPGGGFRTDPDGRQQHEQMGFHEGWGTVVDQMVEHIQTSR
jgi:uncharacterized protein YndB with AHSA1/START domain